MTKPPEHKHKKCLSGKHNANVANAYVVPNATAIANILETLSSLPGSKWFQNIMSTWLGPNKPMTKTMFYAYVFLFFCPHNLLCRNIYICEAIIAEPHDYRGLFEGSD